MNAQLKPVNSREPPNSFRPHQLKALAENPAPMPDQLTDEDINQMAQWYAERQWGELAVGSDSQEWGF